MYKLFFLLILLWLPKLFAAPIYDIQGSSERLDQNLTYFLDQWRTQTISPIREGNYTNIIVNGSDHDKTVALTFDDSPDENITAHVLDVLKFHQVKASFFMIASPMDEINATVVKRAFDEGHLVLNHSFNHPHFTTLTHDQISHELNTSSSRIEEITGKYPKLIRPPYGSLNQNVVDTITTQGFTSVLWSLDSLDWAIKEKDVIIQNVLTHVRNGDIILMHSGRSNLASAEALPDIIKKLHEQGYHFVTLESMFGIQAYR